jgi:dCMP deaminase
MTETRITKNQYAIELAYAAAQRSEDPYLKVGAAAITEDGRVVGLGYNGVAQGVNVDAAFWSDRETRRPFMIHAEQNLCSLFKRGEVDTVATTTLPCPTCATLLCAHGVKRVIWCEEYARDTARESIAIFHLYNVELIHEERKQK